MTEHLSNEIKEAFETIERDLNQGRCILVLGPDALQMNGISWETLLHKKLKANKKFTHLHYHQSDALFVCKNEAILGSAWRETAAFFDNFIPDSEILDQIASLPFRLILSVNPDEFLVEAYMRHNKKPKQAIFRRRDGSTLDRNWNIIKDEDDYLEKFDADTPITINLFGHIKQYETLVIDCDSMLSLFNPLSGNFKLPKPIAYELKSKNNSFLFIGFPLDRWYSQLLLKTLVDSGDSTPKLSYRHNPIKKVETFLLKQFNLQTFKSSSKFLSQFHSYYKVRNLDKGTLGGNKKVDINSIRNLFAAGEHENALKLMSGLFENHPERNVVILLESNFTSYKKEKFSGTLSAGELQTMLNSILARALDLLNDLK